MSKTNVSIGQRKQTQNRRNLNWNKKNKIDGKNTQRRHKQTIDYIFNINWFELKTQMKTKLQKEKEKQNHIPFTITKVIEN